jgi:uncharacterized protein
MPPSSTIFLSLLMFVAALLYSTVGHGGASGYLAAMALFGLAPEVMKPTALTLNLVVAGLGTFRYARAGCFSWNVFWPFALLSIPFAFLGGKSTLPPQVYRILLGLVLLFAAWRLAFRQSAHAPAMLTPIQLPLALTIGAAIGLLSGLTGVGGGIFLSPILLLLGWATVRQTAGVSAAFILVNSIAGLVGQGLHGHGLQALPRDILWWAPAALAGGVIGTELGSRRLTPLTMRRLLAAVLVVAGVKMLVTR